MSLNQHKILLLSALLFTVCGFSQIYNTQVEAKINLKRNAEIIEIIGTAFNKTELNQSLRYVLSVIKNDPKNSNRSKNDQSGRFVLDPGQKKYLSMTTIYAGDKDRIIILLLVYNFDDQLLGKDRIVINGNSEDRKAQAKIDAEKSNSADATHKKDDGVILRGIVVEDTKTKIGRDFYKLFYSEYLKYNINGEKIVTIKETLAIANNTKIEVLVGDVKVLEFYVRPQLDYLKSLNIEAIKRVYLHFQKLDQEKNIVKRY